MNKDLNNNFETTVNKKIQELQVIEQSLQAYEVQHRNVESKILEIDNAIRELTKSKDAYKIIGNFLIMVDKEKTLEELREELNKYNKRLELIKKQEERLKKEADALQKEVMKDIK